MKDNEYSQKYLAESEDNEPIEDPKELPGEDTNATEDPPKGDPPGLGA